MIWSNTDDITFLYTLDLVATMLSFLGSLVMCYFCLKSPSKPVSLKFVFAIGISDLFYSIANIMSAVETNSLTPLCYTEAVIRDNSFIMSGYFANCTAILCYKVEAMGSVFDQEAFFTKAVMLGLSICLILATLPLMTETIIYQNGPLFCWITYSPSDTEIMKFIVKLVYDLLPFVLGVIVSLAGYIAALRMIQKDIKEEGKIQVDARIYRLYWYPCVLFICFAPSAIDNLLQLFLSYPDPVPIKAIHLLFTHSIGFWNAIVYGTQRGLYKQSNSNKSIGLDDQNVQKEIMLPNSISGDDSFLRTMQKAHDVIACTFGIMGPLSLVKFQEFSDFELKIRSTSKTFMGIIYLFTILPLIVKIAHYL